MADRKNIIRYWLPVILWMGVIFVISSIPGEDIPAWDIPYLDKAVHFTEFLILGLLLIRALRNSHLDISLAALVVLAVIAVSLYACVDEWHQQFISSRAPDLFDLAADFLGANIGILIYNKKKA